MAWNDKKLCLSHSISEYTYIIWSCFLLHKFKMMTSPDVFFNFSKFWLSGLLGAEGVKRAIKWPKVTKGSVSLCISGTVPHMIAVFGTHVSNDDISRIFFFFFSFFQKSDFSGFSKFINKCQKEILRCGPPSSHGCDFIN